MKRPSWSAPLSLGTFRHSVRGNTEVDHLVSRQCVALERRREMDRRRQKKYRRKLPGKSLPLPQSEMMDRNWVRQQEMMMRLHDDARRCSV